MIFAGYLEGKDTVAAYHLAHIFAFASTSETQGLVIGEAMAAGLPVVAANDKAVEDFVVDGVERNHRAGAARGPGPRVRRAARRRAAPACSTRALPSSRAQEFSIARQAEKLERHYLRDIELYEPHTILPRIASLNRTGLPGATSGRDIPGLRAEEAQLLALGSGHEHAHAPTVGTPKTRRSRPPGRVVLE